MITNIIKKITTVSLHKYVLQFFSHFISIYLTTVFFSLIDLKIITRHIKCTKATEQEIKNKNK